ncbi:sce7726 family protein [Isoptericola sp. NPDC057191]|uniref:sce7726 family protein n=1 Tax=Isoptericola sp. NPDC057191 TaxID=3346041 RepID=UPI0036427242
MRDLDVRTALRARLDEEHGGDADTLIVDELGLCGQVRVDVAVVNGALSGFELKSARDNLRRLPNQVAVYSRVLDHATLVVAENHRKSAVAMLPDWWGIYVARETDMTTSVELERMGTRNDDVDPMALAQLLWRDEALEELSQRGADRGVRTKPRWQVWQRLADVVQVDELRDVVRGRLKARPGWRDAR